MSQFEQKKLIYARMLPVQGLHFLDQTNSQLKKYL